MRKTLGDCEAGAISPAVALMRMLIESEDAEAVTAFVEAEASPTATGRSLRDLVQVQRAGVERVAAMLRSDEDSPPTNATEEEGIRFCSALFDWSVAQSEEASVALYSLGDRALLQQATDEIVTWLVRANLLGPGRSVLDLGCGIGRLSSAIAPCVGRVEGVDVSSGMLERARARCRDLPNVAFYQSTGRDLRGFADGSFDLVLAVDVFPYLVQSGYGLAATHVEESRRVLRARGDLVIWNFSYRDDGRDSELVRGLAGEYGFGVRTCGARPLGLWDGAVYHLAV